MKSLYKFTIKNKMMDLTPNQKTALKTSMQEVLPSLYTDCYILNIYDVDYDTIDLHKVLALMCNKIFAEEYQSAYKYENDSYAFLRNICCFYQIHFLSNK